MRLKRYGLISAALGVSLSLLMTASSVNAQATTATSNNLELAYVDQSGNAYLKSGNINAPYTKIWNSSDPATAVEVSDNGIAVLDQNGNLYVNQLPIVNTWTLVTTGVSTRNFGISDNNVVLFLDNTLYDKPLAHLTYGWDPFFNNVQGFDISANGNIVAEDLNNTLWEAYGGYGAKWTAIATNFNSYSVSDNEVAVVIRNNMYLMIGAPVNNTWKLAYSNASGVQLSSDGNIGVTDPQGYLNVAFGGYGSQWVNHVSNSEYTDVSDNYVIAVNSGALFSPLNGPGSDVWSQIAGGGSSTVTYYSVE